jgi:hypothetical protein
MAKMIPGESFGMTAASAVDVVVAEVPKISTQSVMWD